MLKNLICCVALGLAFGSASAREHQPQTAKVVVQAGGAGCRIDLDAAAVGATDAAGNLTIPNVEPGDHYVHVDCPAKPEAVYFISPKAGEEVRLGPTSNAPAPESDPAALADNKIQLRQLVQQGVQLRAQARLDEAVAALREAIKLDPANSDLHRELGITFLLAREWQRARVEFLEAIRHDQGDADAHNGLGYALDKLGDINGAAKEYRSAMNLEPDDSNYRTHYYDALVKIQALKELKK